MRSSPSEVQQQCPEKPELSLSLALLGAESRTGNLLRVLKLHHFVILQQLQEQLFQHFWSSGTTQTNSASWIYLDIHDIFLQEYSNPVPPQEQTEGWTPDHPDSTCFSSPSKLHPLQFLNSFTNANTKFEAEILYIWVKKSNLSFWFFSFSLLNLFTTPNLPGKGHWVTSEQLEELCCPQEVQEGAL